MSAIVLRPAWTPTTVLLTIAGFIVWWPLGLAALAYILWGERLGDEFRTAKANVMERMPRFGHSLSARATGNTAFDEYKTATMRRLEEERRKLEAEQREFEAFLHNLRKARDQEEFDRFMAARHASSRS